MPNVASVLKAEIARVARKEVKSATASLNATVKAQRKQIATLRQQVADLGKASRKTETLRKVESKAQEAPSGSIRFSGPMLQKLRARLGLSRAQASLLIEASEQSIYNWETQGTRPNAAALAAIHALRKMSKREIVTKLETLSGA
ncbi:MAG: hypothetical protein M3O62_04140 [Pseudomonadota bacterium]|nr:hypothetical protein [Pseudomonadota bacterium]